MSVLIDGVESNSYAQAKGIKSGHTLLCINGHEINDVLDYRFYAEEKRLALSLVDGNNNQYDAVIVKKHEHDETGLVFSTYLMDKEHSCKNNCIFCFVSQMPKGLRETLYFKDDDSRLSFLFGNYITLTNMSDSDIERIIAMHISPVNISVHTMNPELRVKMMRNKHAGESLCHLRRLAQAGTKINTQIVLCPGINDGDELMYSLSELGKLYPSVQSVAVVPVGITRFREGLYPLEMYNKKQAGKVIDMIDDFNAHFMYYNNGYRLVYAADELYLKAEREIPDAEFYGEFQQLDNGVGMLSLMDSEFSDALSICEYESVSPRTITIATGEAAYPLISRLSSLAMRKVNGLKINTVKIVNRFFGETVTVAGLLTGTDILNTLTEELGDELLIPRVSLRYEGDAFLDGMTVQELSERLGVKVTAVENDGYVLLDRMLGVEI